MVKHSTLFQLTVNELHQLLRGRIFLYAIALSGILCTGLWFTKEPLIAYSMVIYLCSCLITASYGIRLLQHNKQENRESIHLCGIKPATYLLGNLLPVSALLILVNIVCAPFCMLSYFVQQLKLTASILPYCSIFLLTIPNIMLLSLFASISNKYIRNSLVFFWIPTSGFLGFFLLLQTLARENNALPPVLLNETLLFLCGFIFLLSLLFQINESQINTYDQRPMIRLKIICPTAILLSLLLYKTGMLSHSIKTLYLTHMVLGIIWAVGTGTIKKAYCIQPILLRNKKLNQAILSVFGYSQQSNRRWYLLIAGISLLCWIQVENLSFIRNFVLIILAYPAIPAFIQHMKLPYRSRQAGTFLRILLVIFFNSGAYALYEYSKIQPLLYRKINALFPLLATTIYLLVVSYGYYWMHTRNKQKKIDN